MRWVYIGVTALATLIALIVYRLASGTLPSPQHYVGWFALVWMNILVAECVRRGNTPPKAPVRHPSTSVEPLPSSGPEPEFIADLGWHFHRVPLAVAGAITIAFYLIAAWLAKVI